MKRVKKIAKLLAILIPALIGVEVNIDLEQQQGRCEVLMHEV